MDRRTAQQIAELMLRVSSWIDQSTALVEDQSPGESAEKYKQAAGRVMGDILLEVLNPLYAEHPELRPTALGGMHVLDESVFPSSLL